MSRDIVQRPIIGFIVIEELMRERERTKFSQVKEQLCSETHSA